MKKRKELDALVTNGKLNSTKRLACKKSQPRVENKVSAHQLLGNESDSSDMDDFSILNPRRSHGKKNGSSTLCAASCLPLCLMVLVTTCIVALGTLLWLHLGLREDLDLVRAHLQKVEAQNKETPEALHDYHIQLKSLEYNVTAFADELKKLNVEISTMSEEFKILKTSTNNLKESFAAASDIKTLPKDVGSITQSVASLGSKVSVLETTLQGLKEKQTEMDSATHTLQTKQESMNQQIEEAAKAKEESRLSSAAERDNIMALVHKEVQTVSEALDELNTTSREQVLDLNRTLNWATEELHSLHSYVNLSMEDSRNTNVSSLVQQTVLQLLKSSLNFSSDLKPPIGSWQQLLSKASTIVLLYQDLSNQLSLNASSDVSSLKSTQLVEQLFKKINSECCQNLTLEMMSLENRQLELYSSSEWFNRTLWELSTRVHELAPGPVPMEISTPLPAPNKGQGDKKPAQSTTFIDKLKSRIAKNTS